MKIEDMFLELRDNEWKFDHIDHDRRIARAIVYDDDGKFYFVRAERDDDFGKATLIETSGGGVEQNEDLQAAVRRELSEELGVDVEIVCKIGVVSDYYNLIHRHNINNYFLCKVKAFGKKQLTEDEVNCFHLKTLQLSFEEAVEEYKRCSDSRLGRLVANRELPVLLRAKEIIDQQMYWGLNEVHIMKIELIKESEINDVCEMVIRACKYSEFAAFYPESHFYCTYEEVKSKAERGHFYVVKDAGKIIACGGIAPYYGSETESWIHMIFVEPTYQKKGIGKMLIEFLEKDDYAKRATRIEIHAAMSAIPFYRKLGYQHKNGQLIYSNGHFDLEKFIKR